MIHPTITIEQVERWTHQMVQAWQGNCHGIALRMQPHVAGSRIVRGFWHGPLKGYWSDRAHFPFTGHTWLELADGTVIDPTRWSFEDVNPYIYLGKPPNSHRFWPYDEGGNRWRADNVRPCPAVVGSERYRITTLSEEPRAHIIALMGPSYNGIGFLDQGQVFWLSNLPYQTLEPYARAVYHWIDSRGLTAFIPIDNRIKAGLK